MRTLAKAGIAVAVVVLFLGSGIAGFAGHMSSNTQTYQEGTAPSTSFSLHPSMPDVEPVSDEYVTVHVAEADNTIMTAGQPMLPSTTKTMTFPLGTTIQDVQVTVGEVATQQLTGVVAPAPNPLPRNMQQVKQVQEKGPVYDSSELFPSDWLHWRTTVGLRNGDHATILTLQVFPVRYNPGTNELHYIESIEVDVTYEKPATSLIQGDAYDLLVVTPESFTGALQPLVQHKEDHDVATKLVTLNEIYNGAYFESEGRDSAEKIKYFIKDALEDWGITYVMLVGGRHGGVMEEKWWCPVRYAHNPADSDKKYLSDLYFADIYAYEDDEYVFASWDSNENGLYGEWTYQHKDPIDGHPDVYVGRLACRNSYEVQVMVEKIITYETTANGASWSKKYVGMGGDTFPGGVYDGEITVTNTSEYLEDAGYTITTLFTSDGTLSGSQDIIDAMNAGCGLYHFEGHGNPASWATHKPNSNEWDAGIDEVQFMQFTNEGQYPICVVGGCSNSKFNVTVLNLLHLKNIETVISHSDWAPECFSWWMARKVDGGSIATIGCTSYGYGSQGDKNRDGIPDVLQEHGGYIDILFFKAIAEGKTMLGEAWGDAVSTYVDHHPPETLSDNIDLKTIEEWTLLGDPSLKIGGY